MRRRMRNVFVTLSMASLFVVASLPSLAQDTKSNPQKPTANPTAAPGDPAAKRPNDAIHRVPDFFGQIGLTLEQREQIYKVREGHLQKIAELEKQVAAARAAMLVDCEKVLSSTQKDLLTALRKASDERKKVRATKPAASDAPKASGNANR